MTFSSYTKSLVQAGSAWLARAKSSIVPARRLAQTCVVRHTPTHTCASSLHGRGVATSRVRDRGLFDCARSTLRNAKRAYKHQTGPLGERGELQGFEVGKRTACIGGDCLALCVPALPQLSGRLRPDLRDAEQTHARRSGRLKRPGWARSRRRKSGFEAGRRTALVEPIEFSKLACRCFKQSAAGSTRTCETKTKRARVSSFDRRAAMLASARQRGRVRGGGAPLSKTALRRRRRRASASRSQTLDAPRPAR